MEWRSLNNLNKKGQLPDGTAYSLHGVGCYFEKGNFKIDIDFGPDGRHDGFDMNRLYLFSQNYLSTYDEINQDKDEFSNVFNQLIDGQIIFNPKWLPSKHLYYLSDSNSIN